MVFSLKTQNMAYESRRMCFVRASIFQTFQSAFASQNTFVFDVCIARVSSGLDSKIQSLNRFSIRSGKSLLYCFVSSRYTVEPPLTNISSRLTPLVSGRLVMFSATYKHCIFNFL